KFRISSASSRRWQRISGAVWYIHGTYHDSRARLAAGFPLSRWPVRIGCGAVRRLRRYNHTLLRYPRGLGGSRALAQSRHFAGVGERSLTFVPARDPRPHRAPDRYRTRHVLDVARGDVSCGTPPRPARHLRHRAYGVPRDARKRHHDRGRVSLPPPSARWHALQLPEYVGGRGGARGERGGSAYLLAADGIRPSRI